MVTGRFYGKCYTEIEGGGGPRASLACGLAGSPWHAGMCYSGEVI